MLSQSLKVDQCSVVYTRLKELLAGNSMNKMVSKIPSLSLLE